MPIDDDLFDEKTVEIIPVLPVASHSPMVLFTPEQATRRLMFKMARQDVGWAILKFFEMVGFTAFGLAKAIALLPFWWVWVFAVCQAPHGTFIEDVKIANRFTIKYTWLLPYTLGKKWLQSLRSRAEAKLKEIK